jgi:hypothetical protein
MKDILLLAPLDHPNLNDRCFWVEQDKENWIPVGSGDSWSLSNLTAMPLVWAGTPMPDALDVTIRAILGRNWWMLEHVHQLSHVIRTGRGWNAVLYRIGRYSRTIEDKLCRLNLPEGVSEEIQSAWSLAQVAALVVPDIRVEVLR